MNPLQKSWFCASWPPVRSLLLEMRLLPMGFLLRLAIGIIIAAGDSAKNKICNEDES